MSHTTFELASMDYVESAVQQKVKEFFTTDPTVREIFPSTMPITVSLMNAIAHEASKAARKELAARFKETW